MGSWQYNLTVASAVACGAAVVAMFVARRGRRVGDHPLCRKCGFDLFGLPETSHNCPECGRDLRRRRATRVGHRRRFRKVGLLALGVFLAAGGWLGFVGVATARGVNWNQYKPVWWLVRETAVAEARQLALAELGKRVVNGTLDDADMTRVVEAALAHQADRGQQWNPIWGELIEIARTRARISDAVWQRYMNQAADCIVLETRPNLSNRYYIPFRVKHLPVRATALRLGSKQMWRVEPVFVLDGRVLRIAMSTGRLGDQAKPFEGLAFLPSADVMRLEPGEHQFGATIHLEDKVIVPARFDRPGGELIRFPQLRLSKQIRFGPASDVTTRLEAELSSRVEAALRARPIIERTTGTLLVEISSSGTPVDLAFTGTLRAGDLRRELGYVVFPAKGGSARIALGDVLPAWEPGKVDIELTPSLDAAETTLDMKTIWGGQVFLSDLPVEWATPAKKR